MMIPKKMTNEQSKVWANMLIARRQLDIAKGLREGAIKQFMIMQGKQ